jgi:hypothetical protein
MVLKEDYASQSAFALLNEYNKKIGINKRFKYIINLELNQQWLSTDYEIHKMSVHLV